MKKKFFAIMLIFTLLMQQCIFAADDENKPEKDEYGYYCIYTADQLYWVAKNFTSSDICLKLMNDIVVNEGVMSSESYDARIWTPIGGEKYNFAGIIDGQGHTISGLYCPDSKYAALVSSNYGSIRNLGIINSYFYAKPSSGTTEAYAGAFCARMDSNAVIENCYGLDNIVAGKYISGGLVGIATNEASIIRNCYTSSLVKSTMTSQANRKKWADPIAYTIRKDGNAGAQLINVYWDETKTSNAYSARNTCKFNTEQAASGELTYKLNENGIYDVWRQNLNLGDVRDSYPVFTTSHYCVFLDGDMYTNHDDDPSIYGPGNDEPTELKMNDDGYYEIYTVDHLYQFASEVNEKNDMKNAKAKLMNDMIIYYDKIENEEPFYRPWEPIGNVNAPFVGVFDGQGHVISGMFGANIYYELPASGLFGCIDKGAEIKNVVMINSYFYSGSTSTAATGAISAVVLGGSISDCIVRDCKITSEVSAGGISGSVSGDALLKNCFCVRCNINGGEKNSVGAIAGDFRGKESGDQIYSLAQNCHYFNISGNVNKQWDNMLELLPGDADISDSVELIDAIATIYLIDYINENDMVYYAGDFDGDGNITRKDVALILRSVSELDTSEGYQ